MPEEITQRDKIVIALIDRIKELEKKVERLENRKNKPSTL